ncbi:hypothetical protein GG344DRAFT_68846 [Lentinula edodes]|nr:hypothetical protein GG344DRAFT_68846 [Lentinula edodes]
MRTSPGGSEIYFIIELGLQLHKFITPINAVWTSFPDPWVSFSFDILGAQRYQARPVNSPLPGFSVSMYYKSAVNSKKIPALLCTHKLTANGGQSECYRSYNEKEELLLVIVSQATVTFPGPSNGSLSTVPKSGATFGVIFIFVNERRRPPPASIPARLTPETDEDSSVPEMVNGPKTSQITERLRSKLFFLALIIHLSETVETKNEDDGFPK